MTAPDRLLADLDRALRAIDRYTPPLDDTGRMADMDREYAIDTLAADLEAAARKGWRADDVLEWDAEQADDLSERFRRVLQARRHDVRLDPAADTGRALMQAWGETCRAWAEQEAERVLAAREDGR